jgi:hypothetical protein
MEGSRGPHLHSEIYYTPLLNLTTIKLTGWRCGNALDLYSGNACFESRPIHWLFWKISRGFPQYLQKDAGILFWLGHDHRFFPDLFKFIIQQWSYHSMLYWGVVSSGIWRRIFFESQPTFLRKISPAVIYPHEDSWYSFLLETESTPGPYCGWKV